MKIVLGTLEASVGVMKKEYTNKFTGRKIKNLKLSKVNISLLRVKPTENIHVCNFWVGCLKFEC